MSTTSYSGERMSFIIKHIPDGMYVYSADVKVKEKAFARRFSSAKQAKAFMRTADLKADSFSIYELTDDETSQIQHELKILTGKDTTLL